MEGLETFSPEEVAGGSLEINIPVTKPEPEPKLVFYYILMLKNFEFMLPTFKQAE